MFLDPKLKNLSDPFLLPGMRVAIERILQAVDRQERIVLYGDYDVDGVTSLTLFTRVLRGLGADPKPFLPLRMDEGYGLSPEGPESRAASRSHRAAASHRGRLRHLFSRGNREPADAGNRRAGL